LENFGQLGLRALRQAGGEVSACAVDTPRCPNKRHPPDSKTINAAELATACLAQAVLFSLSSFAILNDVQRGTAIGKLRSGHILKTRLVLSPEIEIGSRMRRMRRIFTE